MQTQGNRHRGWRPPSDSSRTEQAAATFTEIEQRTTSSSAASLTEEILAPTEFHPFPSFLDPARAETEVVIQCDDEPVMPAPRARRPPNLARPQGPMEAPPRSQPPATPSAAPAVMAAPRPAPAMPPLALRPAPATPQSSLERVLGFEVSPRRVVLILALLILVSLAGTVLAMMLTSG